MLLRIEEAVSLEFNSIDKIPGEHVLIFFSLFRQVPY